ncbi:MAG: hypothetical protein WBB36_18355, partial [Chitinophagales bacterium]
MSRIAGGLVILQYILQVELKSLHPPFFSKPATAYRFEVQVLYYHATKNVCSSETCFSDWRALQKHRLFRCSFLKRRLC